MQIVPQQFNDLALGDVRPWNWGCRISFTKEYDEATSLFRLNESILNGNDILSTVQDNPIMAWDYYKYLDFTDRIVQMSWDRALEFPYSIATARADFTLANTDRYLTPNPQPIPLAPQITNYSTNPSFEASNGTVEVRRNHVTNPRMSGGGTTATSWSDYSSGTVTGTRSVSGNIQTITQSTGTGRIGVSHPLPTLVSSINAGRAITVSIDVKTLSLGAGTAILYLEAPGGGLWPSASKTITSTGRQYVRFQTSSTGRINLTLYVWVQGGTGTISFTNAMAELIDAELPYFDGATNSGFDTASLTPVWTGAANASASILRGLFPVGTNRYHGAGLPISIWQSRDRPNHGASFARILVPTTAASYISAADTVDIATTEERTFLGYARVSRVQQTTPRWNTQAGGGGSSNPTYAQTIGTSWTEVRRNGTSTHNNASMGFLFASSQAGDIIDLDNHMMVKGVYTGGYRDGSSQNWNWNGVQNGSTSTGDDPTWIPPVLPLQAYILPKRPVRLLSGFKNMIIPQFVGLTQEMPDVNDREGIITFTALDFLTQIYEMPIRNTIAMANVRTDEVLANIFQQFGLTPSQYDLSRGRNTIPFLFFEREQQTAGDVIRKLMEAEGGMLWLNEEGIIKFMPRLEESQQPIYELTSSEIVDLSISEDSQIINKVVFSGELRALAGYQNVYSKPTNSTPNVIMAGSTGVFSAELKDPCLNVVTPVPGEQAGVSWFTAARPNGTIVTGVTVLSVELKTNSYDIVFKNNNAFDVDINRLELYGNPAKVYGTINDKVVEYPPSIEMFEAKPMYINNNFIQTESQMDSLALTILDNYANYASIIDVNIKGNPALQLGDVVELNYRHFTGNYRIIGISSSLQYGSATQSLKLRSYEQRHYFFLNRSILNGGDQLAP